MTLRNTYSEEEERMWTKLTNDDIYNQRQSVPAMVLMPAEVQMKAEGHIHISQQGIVRVDS